MKQNKGFNFLNNKDKSSFYLSDFFEFKAGSPGFTIGSEKENS